MPAGNGDDVVPADAVIADADRPSVRARRRSAARKA